MESTHVALLTAIILMVPALAGCAGLSSPLGNESDNESASPEGEGPDEDRPRLKIGIINYTRSVEESEPVNVTWRIETADGSEATVDETSVHWGGESVSRPRSPEAYGNTSGLERDATVPADFETSFEVGDGEGSGNASGNGSGNASADAALLTRDRSDDLSEHENGSGNESDGDRIYVRARASLDGQVVWSQEVVVEVQTEGNETGNGTGDETGETVTVSIGRTTSPGSFATYDPDPVEIKVGDSIEWRNDDPLFSHTATADDDAPESFDTGDISPGETSDPITFTVPGEYSYHDENGDATGTVIVEAAGGNETGGG